ncbi:hypothetical protein MP228_012149 [Amoeboaphelidium protococcarum]|nr:hypothetical protein MP228_012149 [Amoeboaphelidium protococcarum]
MPKIITKRSKPPPAGWDQIEPQLEEFDQQMREIESSGHLGFTKAESQWPIFRLNHQRSRYLYELYYKRKAISKELYDWCLKQGHGDAALIAKWKKQGYEKLCCTRCIQPKDTNYGSVCICRVPSDKLQESNTRVECQHCGCKGCSSA